tara:strand:- start:74 stop:706 length:633 start_codon:yes stop_codon:yes gene_type:complete
MRKKKGLNFYKNLDLREEKNDEKIKLVYEEWAQNYDSDNDHLLGTVSQPQCVKLVARELEDKDAQVIDVGCGTGLVGKHLKAFGFNSFDGIDISEGMLEVAKTRGYRKLFLGSLNKNLPINDNIYDVTFCVGVFTHGHVKSNRVSELIRITKPGGLICFTVNEGVFEEYDFKNTIVTYEKEKKWEVLFLNKDDYMKKKQIQGYYCLARLN